MSPDEYEQEQGKFVARLAKENYQLKACVVLAVVALLSILAALVLNRPMKVSIFENVYIEVGEGEAGPPAYFEEIIELDGRQVQIRQDGSCWVTPVEEK